ncbi:MAG: hypothetical protein ACI9ES_001013 [Oceanospirillaceae bacterium]|jgi:hypothetical protein
MEVPTKLLLALFIFTMMFFKLKSLTFLVMHCWFIKAAAIVDYLVVFENQQNIICRDKITGNNRLNLELKFRGSSNVMQ